MTEPVSLSELREKGWRGVPADPGVYWWFFPATFLQHFKIADFCLIDHLNLRVAPDGKVCLYHGLAGSLVGRVKWHAAQKLTVNNLRSGYLSTFRLTLLALNGFDYSTGTEFIDAFFDSLSVSWQATETRQAAEKLERAELDGDYHYPLNIAGNSSAELRSFLSHLKLARREYKQFHLSRGQQLGA
jgi:hypothetical protein